jgi:hypothetical protein
LRPPKPAKTKLPSGVSPQEAALKRLSSVSPEAVEKLVWLMRNSRQESIQYNSAIKLLGLNGIVEVEKSISVVADAEAIIRELNKVPQAKKQIEIDVTPPATGGQSSGGDSPPTPQEAELVDA